MSGSIGVVFLVALFTGIHATLHHVFTDKAPEPYMARCLYMDTSY